MLVVIGHSKRRAGLGKVCLMAGFSLMLVMLLSAAASAATDNPHGNYTTNTNACALCHKIHTASSPGLLGFDSTYTGSEASPNETYKICLYCHGAAATGSIYDVQDGIIEDGANVWAAPGGGMEHMPGIEGPGTLASTMPTAVVTSKHKVTSTVDNQSIPGAGTMGTGVLFTCSSCHDPHGTTNSRQLRESITVVDIGGSGTRTTTTTSVQTTVTGQGANEVTSWNSNINTFCGGCHVDYNAQNGGSGHTPTDNTSYAANKYRHPVGIPPDTGVNSTSFNPDYNALPLSSDGGKITCLTCHMAHGTTSTVTNYTPPTGVSPATLLRMDERGVCENCHRKTPSSTPAGVTGVSISSDKLYLVVSFSQYMLAQTAGSPVYGNSALNLANYALYDNSGALVPAAGWQISGTTAAAIQPSGDRLGKVVTIGPIQTGLGAAGPNWKVVVTHVNDLNGTTMSTTANFGTFNY